MHKMRQQRPGIYTALPVEDEVVIFTVDEPTSATAAVLMYVTGDGIITRPIDPKMMANVFYPWSNIAAIGWDDPADAGEED